MESYKQRYTTLRYLSRRHDPHHNEQRDGSEGFIDDIKADMRYQTKVEAYQEL